VLRARESDVVTVSLVESICESLTVTVRSELCVAEGVIWDREVVWDTSLDVDRDVRCVDVRLRGPIVIEYV